MLCPMQKVAILGSSNVGSALAKGFVDNGYAVSLASRDPGKLAQWKDAAGANASTGTYAEAAAWCDLAVLCVKGTAAEGLIRELAPSLEGKVVLDATNPIGDEKPDNGVVRYFTSANESLMERLQQHAPKTKFVKAFNSIGAHLMVQPPFQPQPSMFICGNDTAAKEDATAILTKFGWETVDVGGVEGARPIEALCQLWCAPGFLRNEWSHALKYLK